MKRKLLSILLCGAMVMSLVACGSSTTNTSEKGEATKVEDSSKEESKEETKQEEQKEENIVLVDNEYATITYTGIERDDIMGPKLNLLVENKSDQDIIIQAEGVSTDGMMADPICSIEVVQGKKAKGDLTLMSDSTEKDFKSIEGTLKILNNGFMPLKEEAFSINY